MGCTAASDGCALLRYRRRKHQKKLLGVSSSEKVPYLVMPDIRMSGTAQESGFLLVTRAQMVGIFMGMCSCLLGSSQILGLECLVLSSISSVPAASSPPGPGDSNLLASRSHPGPPAEGFPGRSNVLGIPGSCRWVWVPNYLGSISCSSWGW